MEGGGWRAARSEDEEVYSVPVSGESRAAQVTLYCTGCTLDGASVGLMAIADGTALTEEEAQERAAQERKAQAEAKKKAAEERRRIQMERKLNKSIATASREGLRTYARGRMYDPDRYPTFPYQDPNKLAKLEEIERQRQEEEKASAKKSKGKKGAKGESSLPESPSPQEETKETSVSTLDQAPAADLSPAEPAAEEVEETFVEESFLEEAEEDQNEKK